MEKASFQGVEDTLFLPLAARVRASQRFPAYFCDPQALRFAELEPVQRINRSSSEYAMIASVARYYNTDRMARAFAARHPGGAVVNLGAGLETVHSRIADCGLHFYQVDFPQVIEARRQLLGVAENETLIGCDLNDPAWTAQIAHAPVLLLASGVFQYFRPEAVSALLRMLKARFDHPELIFDATDSVGIRYAQRYVKKTGNQSAMMYFSIDDPAAFCAQEGISLLEVRGFYAQAHRLRGLNLYTRVAMRVADSKGRTKLLWVRL